MLSSTTVAGYTDTLTLASTTKLDFFIIDYYLPDNAGGVALNITPLSTVPEPATWAMTLLGFAGLGLATRRRLAQKLDPARGVRKKTIAPPRAAASSCRRQEEASSDRARCPERALVGPDGSPVTT